MLMGRLTDLQRGIERLHGIIIGISVDEILKDEEIHSMRDWLKMHANLHNVEPFRNTAVMLKRCLKDGIIDEDERDEILQWCLEFTSKEPLPECVTTAIRRLHGVLHGIIIDNIITDEEIFGLRDWLHKYDIFKHHWPFSDTWSLVENILEDNKITEGERKELMEFCRGLSECLAKDFKIYDKEYFSKPWMQTKAPILKPFSSLCDRDVQIKFQGKMFCFTGLAKTGPRKKLESLLIPLGALPAKNIKRGLDYLVIGAQSSPCWAYSTYGRKIEKVIEFQQKGEEIVFLHEDDFIAQVNQQDVRVS